MAQYLHHQSEANEASPARWSELFGELNALFNATVQENALLQQLGNESAGLRLRNAQLERKVKELERELQVWREAHERASTTKEAAEVAKDRLAREIASIKDDSPIIIALIDGDGCIFSQDRLNGGHIGGRNAALALHSAMVETATTDLATNSNKNVTVCATVYCNRKGLRDAATRFGACTEAQFDAFWLGFSQAVGLFTMVDVGPGKEAADAKLREALRMYARLPQVTRVFFGGAHDGGYRAPLAALTLEKCAHKVSLIATQEDIAYDLRSLQLDIVRWKGLFMRHNLNVRQHRTPTVPAAGTSGGTPLGVLAATATPASLPAGHASVEINTNPRRKQRTAGNDSQRSGQRRITEKPKTVKG